MIVSRRPSRALAELLLVALGSAWAPRARAADGAVDDPARSNAVELFEQGVKKMDDGKCEAVPVGDAKMCDDARELFRESWEANPSGLGSLRNLAFVEKALGRLASAAVHFRELARRAPLDPRPARRLWADFAQKELVSLEPRIPHLVVQLPSVAPPRTTATLDGAPLARESWGKSLEVDPGVHVVHFEGPTVVAYDEKVTLAEAQSKTLVVTLTPRADTTRAVDPPPLTPQKPPPTVDAGVQGSTRTWALVTAGVGAAVVVVGLGFGVAAYEKRTSSCGAHYCDPAGYATGERWARISDVTTGVGALALVGGITWWFLAKPKAQSTVVAPYASAEGAGVVLVGRF